MRRIFALMLRSAGAHATALRASLRVSAAAALLQAVTYALLLPLLAVLLRRPIDTTEAWSLIGVFALILVVEEALRVREMRFSYANFPAVTGELRLRVGDQLRSMPPEELDRRRSGELSGLLGGSVASAVQGIGTFSRVFLQTVLVPAALLVVVFVADWRLGLVLAATVACAFPFVRRIQAVDRVGYGRVDASDTETAARIVEYTQGLYVFKATGQAGPRARRLGEAVDQQRLDLQANYLGLFTPGLLTSTVVELGLIVMVAYGTARVLDAQLSPAAFAAIAVIAIRFGAPIAAAAILTGIFDQTEVGLARIDDLLSIRALPTPARPQRPVGRDIVFDHVTFTYRGQSHPALHDISFSAPEGRLTALVGPSGSGKSTIARLVLRYADVDEGAIRLGGVDIREVDEATLVSRVSAVFQDVFLFDDTIDANIRMGRPDATIAQVEAAARAAHCHDFVASLPLGYETRVGELGGRLSGGERQRISIARTILKDASIVVLDEPTAALDSAAEIAVQRAIDHLAVDRTVIVIAHRLSTIQAANNILVLDRGRVVEQGVHAELLKAGSRYASMWEARRTARHWRLSDGRP